MQEFRSTFCRDRSAIISWLPIFELSSDFTVGLSQTGYWVVVSNDNLFLIDNKQSYLFIMRVLEIPIEILNSKIIKCNDKDRSLEFPYYDLVKFTLQKSNSSYWIELALRWIPELKNAEKADLIVDLSEVLLNKKYPQQLRHRIQKQIKEIEILKD